VRHASQLWEIVQVIIVLLPTSEQCSCDEVVIVPYRELCSATGHAVLIVPLPTSEWCS